MVSKGLTFNKMYELLEKGTCLLKASEKYRGNMVENENYDLQVALACALIASTASVVIKVKKRKDFGCNHIYNKDSSTVLILPQLMLCWQRTLIIFDVIFD